MENQVIVNSDERSTAIKLIIFSFTLGAIIMMLILTVINLATMTNDQVRLQSQLITGDEITIQGLTLRVIENKAIQCNNVDYDQLVFKLDTSCI